MEYGPVDVIVLATGEPKFDGSVLDELIKLHDKGIIRVLDAMVLVADQDGNVNGLDIEDLPAEDAEMLGFIDTGTRGMFDSTDAETLSEGMVPGSAIVALALENTWAVPLMNAFIAAGAEVALHSRIPAPLVDDALSRVAAK